MGFFGSRAAVETDCPNCDLIERHPLGLARRAKVFTCQGCAHRYVANPSALTTADGRLSEPLLLYVRAETAERAVRRRTWRTPKSEVGHPWLACARLTSAGRLHPA